MKISFPLISVIVLSILVFSNCKNEKAPETEIQIDVNDEMALIAHLNDNYINFGIGSVQIALFNGPYQMNGGAPWYSMIPVGTPGKAFKFGMDTGNNGIWLTSTLCQTLACTQPGRSQFDPSASSTFTWIDQTVDSLSFGPWGTMAVEQGQDYFGNNMALGQPTKMLLAQNYSGAKFAELDWDGGIGFPSKNPDPRTSWFLEQIVNAGLVDPNNVIVTFIMRDLPKYGKMGYINIGPLPTGLVDMNSKLVMPYVPYTTLPGLEYLWSTPMTAWVIDNQRMGNDATFVFDTGSSDFKGDTTATNRAIATIQNSYGVNGTYPDMNLYMGTDASGNLGQLTLTGSQYMQHVDKGQGKGQTVIPIDTLDIASMLLVGSVLLDNVVSSYVYDATGSPGNYTLTPRETWVFNKANGPVVIQ